MKFYNEHQKFFFAAVGFGLLLALVQIIVFSKNDVITAIEFIIAILLTMAMLFSSCIGAFASIKKYNQNKGFQTNQLPFFIGNTLLLLLSVWLIAILFGISLF